VIVEEDFRANLTLVEAVIMDGHSIIVYNKYIVKMEVTNSFSEYCVSDVDFIATDIKRYNTILG
jgi:hypothetical protein